jgi:hypothetical protein
LSVRILAMAIIVPESRFDRTVEAAAPVASRSSSAFRDRDGMHHVAGTVATSREGVACGSR